MVHSRAALMGVLALVMTAPTVTAQPASTARGEALVARNCSGCHAIGRTGVSPNPASPPFRELHRRYPVENLAEALSEGILTGHPQMPEFRFAPAEVLDIIAYLKSIQTQQGAMVGDQRGAHAAP